MSAATIQRVEEILATVKPPAADGAPSNLEASFQAVAARLAVSGSKARDRGALAISKLQAHRLSVVATSPAGHARCTQG